MKLKRMLFNLSLIARGVGLFPILIIFPYLYRRQYDSNFLGMYIIGLVAVILLGCLQVRLRITLEDKLDKAVWLAKIIEILGYILEIGGVVLYVKNYLTINLVMQLGTIIYYLIFYMLSITSQGRHYSNIFSNEIMVVSCGLYIIAIALCHNSVLGIICILLIGTDLFISNQVKLENLSIKAGDNTPMYYRIRNENMKRIGIIIGGMIVAYPFRKGFIVALTWLKDKLISVIIGFIQLMMKLTSHASRGKMGSVPIARQGNDMLPTAEQGSPLWDIIFYTIFTVVAIKICYEKRKQILGCFINLWNFAVRLYKRVIHFLYMLFGKNEKDTLIKRTKNEYYEDTFETVKDDFKFHEAKSKMTTKRMWKGKVKKYLKQAPEQAPYRRGYQLLLQGISFKKIQIDGSKTPHEIMNDVKNHLEGLSIEKETKIYEEIRYWEREEKAEEVELLKQLLKVLSTQI